MCSLSVQTKLLEVIPNLWASYIYLQKVSAWVEFLCKFGHMYI